MITSGIVRYTYIDEGKNVISISLSEEESNHLINEGSTKVSFDDSNMPYVTAHTRYPYPIYILSGNKWVLSDIEIDEIGSESEVILAIETKDGEFKNEKNKKVRYTTNYLKGIRIKNLVERKEEDPFAEIDG